MLEHPSVKAIFEQLQEMGLSEDKLASLKLLLKAIEKETISNDFKMRRIIMDKHIITNVLNSTIDDLEKKLAYIEATNTALQQQKEEIEAKNLALLEQKKIIEAESNYKDRFLANISHELRTPLNGVLGISHLLDHLLPDAQAKEYLGVIRNSAQHLSAIVNDLLDLSRLNVHQLQLYPQPFLLSTMLNNLYAIVRLQCVEKGIELRFNHPPDLPDCFIGDSVRLYQILMNLLNNAIKFTHQGYVELSSHVLERCSSGYLLQFVVQDTGIGVESEKLDSIFEGFKQVFQTQSRYGGAGLGLSIVKQLVELMGGSISVSSKLTAGTRFAVNLWFEVASSEAIAEQKAHEQQILISRQWKSKRVLLVEDNPLNRLYAQNLFVQWNLRTDEAETVAEAKIISQQYQYDCIFVDIGLPDGRGFDLIEWLQGVPFEGAINTQTPIIILTAAVSESYKNAAEQLHITAYLTKPFMPDELFNQLTSLFNTCIDPKTNLPILANLQQETRAKQPEKGEKYYLENLRRLLKGNKKYMSEILAIVVSQIPETIGRLEKSIPEQDWETVYFETHRIKSTLTTLGIDSMKQPILKIEQLLREKDYSEQIVLLFEEFKQQCNLQMSHLQATLLALTQTIASPITS